MAGTLEACLAKHPTTLAGKSLNLRLFPAVCLGRGHSRVLSSHKAMCVPTGGSQVDLRTVLHRWKVLGWARPGRGPPGRSRNQCHS